MKFLDVPKSGSIAGQTFSRNRNGQYVRTRAMPTQPRTTQQLLVRTNLSLFARLWGGLGEGTQSAWISAAALIPKIDSLGQTYYLTGFQYYVGVNTWLALIALTPVTSPPAPPVPIIGTAVVGTVVKATPAFPFVVTTYTGKLYMYASPPQHVGVNFMGDYRFIGSSTITTGSADFGAAYNAKFPGWAAGQKIFFKVGPSQGDAFVPAPGGTGNIIST